MLEPLIILAGLVLLVLVLYWQIRDPWPQKGRETPEFPASCAWCIHRAGEDCTNPASPVYRWSCGPVCIGVKQREMREVY